MVHRYGIHHGRATATANPSATTNTMITVTIANIAVGYGGGQATIIRAAGHHQQRAGTLRMGTRHPRRTGGHRHTARRDLRRRNAPLVVSRYDHVAAQRRHGRHIVGTADRGGGTTTAAVHITITIHILMIMAIVGQAAVERVRLGHTATGMTGILIGRRGRGAAAEHWIDITVNDIIVDVIVVVNLLR